MMNIEYVHASKYGNGAKVAEEFKKLMAAKEVIVNVHHVRSIRTVELPPADLYLFSSPGRLGKPIGEMQRFLKKVQLPCGTKYAILATELMPRLGDPSQEDPYQHITSVMDEILQGKGLVKVTEGKIFVTGLKGPLEADWQKKVAVFADSVA